MISDEIKKYRDILTEMSSGEEKAVDVLDYYHLVDELVKGPDFDDMKPTDWNSPSIKRKVDDAYQQLVNKYGKDFANVVDDITTEIATTNIDDRKHYLLIRKLGINPNSWYNVAGKSLGIEKPV